MLIYEWILPGKQRITTTTHKLKRLCNKNGSLLEAQISLGGEREWNGGQVGNGNMSNQVGWDGGECIDIDYWKGWNFVVRSNPGSRDSPNNLHG